MSDLDAKIQTVNNQYYLDAKIHRNLVSFPDPAFIESGSGTFRAISCIC